MEGPGTAALLVGVAATTAVVAGLCRRLGLPSPLVLVLVGCLGSLIPWVPDVRLEPDVVLVGVLPPLLYATAIRTSLVDFHANRRAIGLLSVGAVLVTTAVVGLVVMALLPVPAAAAFALGAVVAPPDAVAATSIARRVGMPRQTVTVLEGESLVNDATALVCLRTALAALAGGVAWWQVGWGFVQSAGGGLLVGLAVAWVLGRVRTWITDPVLDTTTSLLAPYLAYLPAEEIGASGVLAVVVTGLVLGHQAPVQQSAASRISERTNWRTVQFLLENAVFLLIGLQVVAVVRGAAHSAASPGRTVATCAAVLGATVLVRPLWVFVSARAGHLLVPSRTEGAAPATWPALTVVSWAGMRGVVTLAAVFGLPDDTPLREVLVLAAFVVAAGTLLGQGSTLPWLVRHLPLPAPDPAQDTLVEAQVLQEAHEAGLERLEELLTPDLPEGVVQRLQDRSQRRADAVWERITPSPGQEPPTVAYERLRLQMLAAERRTLLRLRDENDVPDEVLRRVSAIIDVEESLLDRLTAVEPVSRNRRGGAPLVAEGRRLCRHLQAAPGGADALDDDEAYEDERPAGCPDCVAEGRSDWVTLRRCLTCGHVGCCDSSPRTHAAAHFRTSGHPVMRSAEPGEAWRWCYVDRLTG
jgi:monovalent cation/hydrogen antiporter